MRSSESIESMIRKLRVKASAALDNRVHGEISRALEESGAGRSAAPHMGVWKMIMKSRITKFAAAAVIVTGVLIGINVFEGTTGWARVVEAFNKVEQVHIVQKTTLRNGQMEVSEVWLRRGDGFRSEDSERIVVDDGNERLTVNKKKMQAQLCDSWLDYEPPEEHHMFEQIGLFRNNTHKELTISKLSEQSDAEMLVYSLKYEHEQLKFLGKAWVEAGTMLPLRIEVALTGRAGPDQVDSGEVTFGYEPIAEEVFDTTIPAGFKELPRKIAGSFSGRVVDGQGIAATGAKVYVKPAHANTPETRLLEEISDGRGLFHVQLPPNVRGLYCPIFVWAVPRDDAGKVAWTMIRGPTPDDREFGGDIPGDPGQFQGSPGLWCEGASEIVLQMAEGGKITGRVTNTDGNPIAGEPVSVTFDLVDSHGNVEYGSRFTWSTSGLTDSQGYYAVGNLPRLWNKTRWQVIAVADGYVASEESLRVEGTLVHREVDLQLYRGGITVTGRVVDNYGEPLAEREVKGTANKVAHNACMTKTDDAGRFRLTGCPVTEDLQIKADLSHNRTAPHLKEKWASYTYYPDVTVGIDYEQGKLEYEVMMVAERPESTIEVEVVDSSGEPLPYCPVEIQGVRPRQWRSARGFERRTDDNGYCRFTEAPNIKGLRIAVYPHNQVMNEPISENEVERIRKEYRKYRSTHVPVDILPGKQSYKVRAVVLTHEECEQMKNTKPD